MVQGLLRLVLVLDDLCGGYAAVRCFRFEKETIVKAKTPKMANADESDVSKIVGKADVQIWSRDGSECGTTTGQVRPCKTEGCPGQCIEIKWPDEELTWICTEDLVCDKGRWQIRPTPSRKQGTRPL